MRRRDFVTILGGAAAWPFWVRAQQATPVIGFFSPASPEDFTNRLHAFRQGLGAKGYLDGRNVTLSTTGWKANTMTCRRLWLTSSTGAWP